MFQRLTRRVLELPAFGLDISDLTIKFCRLRETSSALEIDIFGEIEIPEGIVVGGEIKKPNELAAILGEGLRTADGRKVRERFCVASLPEEKSFVRMLELPNLKAEDIAKAIPWEVEGVIPLSVDKIFFDYEVIPEHADAHRSTPAGPAAPSNRAAPIPAPSTPRPPHRDVLLTAFPREIVESYDTVLRKAGFWPIAIELESQAISRAIMHDAINAKPVIIIDIGATRTSFIIFAGGSLLFTKSITLGGHDFDLAIAEKLGVALADARTIKIEAGLNKNFRAGKVFDALSVHLAAITNELDGELAFYQSHPAKQHETYGDIERIILCGGDANLIGLEKYIGTSVKKLTVVGDPFVNCRMSPGTIPSIPKNKSLKYTTAIGLALRAIGH